MVIKYWIGPKGAGGSGFEYTEPLQRLIQEDVKIIIFDHATLNNSCSLTFTVTHTSPPSICEDELDHEPETVDREKKKFDLISLFKGFKKFGSPGLREIKASENVIILPKKRITWSVYATRSTSHFYIFMYLPTIKEKLKNLFYTGWVSVSVFGLFAL